MAGDGHGRRMSLEISIEDVLITDSPSEFLTLPSWPLMLPVHTGGSALQATRLQQVRQPADNTPP